MKKRLSISRDVKICFSFVLLLIASSSPFAQTRYLDPMFPNVNVTHGVRYGNNFSALPRYTTNCAYPLVPDSMLQADLQGMLIADVYEPTGDTNNRRWTVFVAHGGSELPIFYNQLCSGTRSDSQVTWICTEFAKRGFTAISYDYRLGWHPISGVYDTRSGTELQGIGRSLQDAKACVRFFRNDAMNSNTWHINPNKLIIGGEGVGGDVALNYDIVESDLQLLKFLSSTTDTCYYLTTNASYFDSTKFGNVDGYGGLPYLNNSNNTPGVSNAVQFQFGLEPVIGDSTWIKQGNPPMVIFHTPADLTNPFYCGIVSIPLIGPVADVCGTHTIAFEADTFHNNKSFQNNNWTDPYTVNARKADGLNPNLDGLYQFISGLSDPYDYCDSTTIFNYMIGGLAFTLGAADTVWYNYASTHPGWTPAIAHQYIDTVFGYLTPRIYRELGGFLPGVFEINMLEKAVSVYPNPSAGQFTVAVSLNQPILAIEMTDATGRLVKHLTKPTGNKIVFDRNHLDAGIYFVKLRFDQGDVVKKIILQ